MGLTEYKRKRHFTRTPEPPAVKARRTGWTYAVQKHDASRLHYDFRLELDGVLKSWAVPKGPSLDPAVKRLAVQVEDHPVDYGGFEGIIPEGEYGGGTVLLWDRGSWEPIGDPHEGYRQGKLKFQLHGDKLHGGWMLVRSRSRPNAKSPEWLLIKERDEESRPSDEGDILEEAPQSVVTGRDLNEIAAASDQVWSSNRTASHQRNGKAKSKQPARRAAAISMPPGTPKETLPPFVELQLATLTKAAPSGDEWLHEVKFDGYRMLCRIDNGRVTLTSRNRQDWTSRLAALAEGMKALPVRQALLDGEVVALQEDGTSDFQSLQNAFREGRIKDLHYYVFDLLHLDGHNLRELPLQERKTKLAELLDQSSTPPMVSYSEHIEADGDAFLREACRMKLEGIISKRRDRPYQSGRGYDWLKVKCVNEEEFVIGGYTDPSGARAGFGALLLGYYDSTGKLTYAGKVGTGFDDRTLTALHRRLKSLEQDQPAFKEGRKVPESRKAHWVRPELVAQISYASRTRDGRLRHPSFLGLREDKPAEDVMLDQPVPLREAVKKSGRKAASKKAPANKTRSAPVDPSTTYDPKTQQFHGVRLTSPDKVLYAEQGLTKIDLASYYRDVAEWILPHIQHRPLVLVRCPEGRHKECFYQKHPHVGTPAQLRQIPIKEKSRTEPYVLVDDVAGLIALAQIGTLEIHAWGSREDQLERPDRLIFDLDPAPDVPWKQVVASARQVREFLQELELESFLKTTGGKGLHLVVPIERHHDWDEAKAFCKLVAEMIVSAAPGQYTSNMSKAARTNKIFIDYLRNGRGATAVVPYSTRSKPGATVSAPLSWRECSPRITSDHFTVSNIRRRLSSLKSDPWEGIEAVRQNLTQAMKRLKSLS